MNIKKEMIIMFMVICPFYILGQGFSPYFTNDKHQKYINYLINAGLIKPSHVLSQPFSVDELINSLPKQNQNFQRHWLGLLRKDLYELSQNSNDLIRNGRMTLGIEGDIREKNKEDHSKNYYSGNIFVNYSWNNFGFLYKLTIDEAFKEDTSYFGASGKIGEDVIYRPSEAYVQWSGKNTSLFLGRINRNYGINGEPSLILSYNPYSFDHIEVRFVNKTLKFTTLFARLNDIYGFDNRDTIPLFKWNTRFLSMNHFEISLSRRIEIAFTEAMLFGGKDTFPQLQYVNPANIFFISKMSDRKGYEEKNANAFLCFDLYYKPYNKFTFYSQYLIDDVDFVESLRDVYPDRLGITMKVIYSELLKGSQIHFTYNRINNWTYNSFYTWGNYTYYGKSLGYPKHGVERIKIGTEIFRYPPFMIDIEFISERERRQNLQSPFIAKKTKFPIGIPQEEHGIQMNITYFPSNLITFNILSEYVQIKNFHHILRNKKNYMNFIINLKLSGILQLLN